MAPVQTFEPLPAPELAEVSFLGKAGAVSYLTDDALFAACGTRIAFTARHGGLSAAPYQSLNLNIDVGDEPETVMANRSLLLDAVGAPELAASLVNPRQVHGDTVVVVDRVQAAQEEARAGSDGVLCARPDVPVLLCFADCTPVIVVAPGGAFAVLHAGWRGALAGIAGKGLAMLAAQTGVDPAECNAYIGPHIGACCYETSAEILGQFVDRYGSACDAGARHLSLSAAVTSDLLANGADPARIVDAGICTSCNVDEYYSYRAEDGLTGRHGAFALRRGQDG